MADDEYAKNSKRDSGTYQQNYLKIVSRNTKTPQRKACGIFYEMT